MLDPVNMMAMSSDYREAVSVIVAVTRLVDGINDTISVGLPTAVASRGLLTALATAAVAVTLITGLLANRGIVDHPPLEVLRQET